MKAPLLRPPFTVPLRVSREEAKEVIRRRLMDRADLAGRWRGKGRWISLYVRDEDRKLWSPHGSRTQ